MNVLRNLRRRAHTAAGLFGQLIEAFRQKGFSGAAHFCSQKTAAIIREKRRGKNISGANVSADFDRRFGVDTTGIISMTSMTVDSPNYLHATVYKAVRQARFEEALRCLSIPFPEHTFIDIGSGKGLALLLASHRPFRRVLGIEFAQELHEIASSNIEKYRNPEKQCPDVRSIHADAAAFPFPEEPLTLFLYHPFEEELMTKVIARIAESYRAHPRPLVVVYMQPKLRRLWESQSFLRLQSEVAPVPDGDGHSQPAFLVFATPEAAWK